MRDTADTIENLSKALTEAAENNLKETDTEIQKPYISKNTWDLIENRNKLNKEGNTGQTDFNRMNKHIKKEAYKDKKTTPHITIQ